MKILVMGAGVVGIATAYYLWKDGHEVTVIERQSGPGMETSFGNAGGLCPSFAGPWAAPGMVGKVLKLSLQRNSPIRFSPIPDPVRLAWAWQWMRNCNPGRFRENKLRMQRVAHYSQACLRSLFEAEALPSFNFLDAGVLQLFRTQAELDLGKLSAQALDEYGVPCRLLSAEEAGGTEPALTRTSVSLSGALHLPQDASGDSHKFARNLAFFLAERGVQFQYDTTIRSLDREGDAITRIHTSSGTMTAQAYVVALGPHAAGLLKPLGLRLPIYPLKGYSITVPVSDPQFAPRMAIMDEHNKIMISRLGDRVRAAGMAELAGYNLNLNPARRDLLIRVVKELFPLGLDWDKVDFWAGLRPMTPDGPPILGSSPWKNLFLNSGHGSNGWTQSCGTGRIVADLISGRAPEIDMDGLTIKRFA